MCNISIRRSPVPAATSLLSAKGAPAVMIAIVAPEPPGVPPTPERVWQAIQPAIA